MADSSLAQKCSKLSLTILAAVLVVGMVGAPLTESTTAQESLSVSIDAPSKATADEPVTVGASVSIPDLVGDYESELTVTLSVDGEQVASKTVTVADGETTSVSFSHTFASEGTHTVTVSGEVTLAGQSFGESVSASIDVTLPATPTVTPPPTPDLESKSLDGAAFPVPESLQDEVDAYRQQVTTDVGGQAFVLATQNALYVVLTDQPPTKGRATVDGLALERNVTHEDLTFGVIAASSVSFETTGTEATVRDVANNPGEYRLDLVRVSATHRQVAMLTDPDSGNDFTLSTEAGILVSDPRTAVGTFEEVGERARALTDDLQTGEVDAALSDPRGPHLHTFAFETEFWTDAPATVDALVLAPGSAARKYVNTFDRAGTAHAEEGRPLLYVVDESRSPRSVDSVSDLKSRADSLDGQVVSLDARMFQVTTSVQEVLEHNTACGDDQFQAKDVCINLPQDELLHGGVVWNGVPQSRDDVLFVLGISSRHQDSPTELRSGRYRIVGEVVSTSRIDPSLPEASVLVVYDLERLGDIDYEGMAEETRALVENRTEELTARLRAQVTGESASPPGDSSPRAGAAVRTISDVVPGEPADVAINGSTGQAVGVERVSLNVSERLRNVTVSASRVSSLPSAVEQPPGRAVEVVNVSVSAPDSSVQNATIRLTVNKSAPPADGNLTVYRYHDGSWNALPTTVAVETDTTVELRVTTTGFSYFAVSAGTASDAKPAEGPTGTEATTESGTTGQDSRSTESTSSTQSEIPGFSLTTGFGAVVVLLLWRRGLRLSN